MRIFSPGTLFNRPEPRRVGRRRREDHPRLPQRPAGTPDRPSDSDCAVAGAAGEHPALRRRRNGHPLETAGRVSARKYCRPVKPESIGHHFPRRKNVFRARAEYRIVPK